MLRFRRVEAGQNDAVQRRLGKMIFTANIYSHEMNQRDVIFTLKQSEGPTQSPWRHGRRLGWFWGAQIQAVPLLHLEWLCGASY